MNFIPALFAITIITIKVCLSKSSITDIIIPFHPRQIGEVIKEIDWWKSLHPTTSTSSLAVQVTFFSSGPPNEKIKKLILGAMSDLPFLTKRSISSFGVEFASIPKSHDDYLEGSKIQWEMFIKHDKRGGLRLLKGQHHVVDHALYLEPDCHPTQSGWLDILNSITEGDEEFWMKGSLFRGQGISHSSQVPFNIFHINGNAIYNLKDPTFVDWYFQKVKPYIKSIPSPHKTPYDTDLFRYFLQKENWKSEARHLLHKFKLTDLIQNRWHSEYNLKDLLRKTPKLAIVHGGKDVKDDKLGTG